jgi:hypothetical protein
MKPVQSFLAFVLVANVALAAGSASDVLSPFEPLVGTVWVASFPGSEMIDEQEFEWVFGGKFLRNVHRVKNAEGSVVYEGETIYAWDVTTQTVVWWYWNSTGGYVTGTLEKTTDGWAFEGANHARPPQPERVRGLFRLGSAGEWHSVQYFEGEDGWEERFTMTFTPLE